MDVCYLRLLSLSSILLDVRKRGLLIAVPLAWTYKSPVSSQQRFTFAAYRSSSGIGKPQSLSYIYTRYVCCELQVSAVNCRGAPQLLWAARCGHDGAGEGSHPI
jgi:hypothetical protein